ARLAWILNAQTRNLRIDFHNQKGEEKNANENFEWSNRDHFIMNMDLKRN
ncbi:5186_t:CDS:1, partial [Paraglomus brasilianum]